MFSLVTQRTRTGAPIEVESSVITLRDAAGERVGYVGVSRDVAHRRRLEARLEETRHLELVGAARGRHRA